MYSSLIMIALSAALVGPVQASAPATPEAWRGAAEQDLTAIHDILRDNSPAMMVARDSRHFRVWLDEGLRLARADLPKVSDGRGYDYLLEGYVAGFRDGHIQFGLKDQAGVDLQPVAWPGFVLGFRGGGYEVVFRDPDARDAPPLHTRLVSCDGKAAEVVAMEHDRYDGDFTLAGGRYRGARSILLDEGDPFIVRPRTCAFRSDGVTRRRRLDWRRLDRVQSLEIEAALHRPRRKLGLAHWAERSWWITLPSLTSDQDWNGFYADIAAHLDALRVADLVVVDLRGDGGGDSSFADRLARLLWGEAIVNARSPDLGPTVWRATRLNRDFWAGLVDKAAADPNYTPELIHELRRILPRFDEAMARGDATFEDADPPTPRADAGANPMHARVILLTDYACASACLDLMDEFTAMPDVVQAGTVTAADTIFMELTIVPTLPSGLSEFAFGHKAWVKRPRGSNVPYIPAPQLTWTGEPSDEAGLRTWLATALKTR